MMLKIQVHITGINDILKYIQTENGYLKKFTILLYFLSNTAVKVSIQDFFHKHLICSYTTFSLLAPWL